MALNEIRNDRPANSDFFKCPSTVKGGDPVLIGSQPAVALSDYNATDLGTVFRFSGTHQLTVTAATVLSPLTGVAMKQGQKIFADTNGTTDANNVTTGFTLDGATGGTLFGILDQTTALVTATTGLANVKIKETP